MIHTNNPIIKHKAGSINLAEELGNISKARKIIGASHDTFDRYQELVEDEAYGERACPTILKALCGAR